MNTLNKMEFLDNVKSSSFRRQHLFRTFSSSLSAPEMENKGEYGVNCSHRFVVSANSLHLFYRLEQHNKIDIHNRFHLFLKTRWIP